jgi:hypothetical protein
MGVFGAAEKQLNIQLVDTSSIQLYNR